MKDVDTLINGKAEKQWDEVTRQNYVEYKQGQNTCKIWIEDLDSIREKLLLANEKELAGVAFWEKDRESEEVWDLINEVIFNNNK